MSQVPLFIDVGSPAKLDPVLCGRLGRVRIDNVVAPRDSLEQRASVS